MAFVIEEIPREERMKYGRFMSHLIIDHEKNAFLVYTGGGRENYSFYDLHWNDDIIHFRLTYSQKAREREDGEKYQRYDLTQTLYQIKAPKSLEKKEQEIRQLIQESLITIRFGAREDMTGTVTITNLHEQPITYI